MNKILNRIIGLVILTGLLASCHKIDVRINSELTPETFPQTESQYNAVMGPVYTALRQSYATDYFFLQSMSTDESLLPTYAADWIDGNRYLDLHRHTWTKDHPNVGGGWSFITNLIGTTNQTIYIVRQSADGPTKSTSLAELQTMRAYFY